MAIVRNDYNWDGNIVLTVKVDWLREEKPPPNPTQAELDALPERFRCIVCLEMCGKKHFACSVGEARVCDLCYPYIDDKQVAYLIEGRKVFPALKYSRNLYSLVKDVWAGLRPWMIEESEL